MSTLVSVASHSNCWLSPVSRACPSPLPLPISCSQVARDYKDEPEFYYPHTLDFRGRAYPIHPSLQHLGDDSCRGLLTCAEAVPLGTDGLDWLYVHLANVWGQGFDKLTFDARRWVSRPGKEGGTGV